MFLSDGPKDRERNRDGMAVRGWGEKGWGSIKRERQREINMISISIFEKEKKGETKNQNLSIFTYVSTYFSEDELSLLSSPSCPLPLPFPPSYPPLSSFPFSIF